MTTEMPFKQFFNEGWEFLKRNFILLVGLEIASYIFTTFVSHICEGGQLIDNLGRLICFIFTIIFELGFTKIGLDVVDGKVPSVDRFKEVSNHVASAFLCAILFVLGVLVGFVLFVIPGIILLVRWQFSIYFILEGCSATESLRKSWQLTQGNTCNLILLFLFFIFLGLCGTLCFGVGIIVASAYIELISAQVYRYLQAQNNISTPTEAEPLKNV